MSRAVSGEVELFVHDQLGEGECAGGECRLDKREYREYRYDKGICALRREGGQVDNNILAEKNSCECDDYLPDKLKDRRDAVVASDADDDLCPFYEKRADGYAKLNEADRECARADKEQKQYKGVTEKPISGGKKLRDEQRCFLCAGIDRFVRNERKVKQNGEDGCHT